KGQYNTSNNLRSRGNLHARYSTSPISWFHWLFDHYELQPNQRVLVCGGGPGMVWESNLDRVPSGVEVVFSDVSPGMVAEAEERLISAEINLTFRVIDVMNIPYEDNSFDIVTANHMLYHVPDIAQSLAEMRRVLKPTGTLFAATNGEDHMRELKQFRRILVPPTATTDYEWPLISFRLETGAAHLAKQFDTVSLNHFNDSLAVTDFDPLVAYATSIGPVQKALTDDTLVDARAYFDTMLSQHGAFNIIKSTCVFIAR
ncbi:MAG: class I SAM-dependent methyltransferase, partial [Candidatus Promineifilaceae bacterium]